MLAIVALVFMMIVGCSNPIKPQEKKVWIEFRSLQQALDSFAKMDGHNLGVKVCVQGTWKQANEWLPQGAAISGGCEPLPLDNHHGFWFSKDNIIANFFIDGEQGTYTGGVLGQDTINLDVKRIKEKK